MPISIVITSVRLAPTQVQLYLAVIVSMPRQVNTNLWITPIPTGLRRCLSQVSARITMLTSAAVVQTALTISASTTSSKSVHTKVPVLTTSAIPPVPTTLSKRNLSSSVPVWFTLTQIRTIWDSLMLQSTFRVFTVT